MATLEKVDVVIIGAGAAGGIYAAQLVKAGKKVVLLDQGPEWERGDLISSEIWGRRLKYGGPPVVLDGKHPVSHGFNTGRGFGGAALHHFANWPTMLPADFKMKSLYGRGLDWPITYADLQPYYERVADEVGVSGDAESEKTWRPVGRPFPMPPLKSFRHADIWRKGFSEVGMKVVPMSNAINSVDYKGRPACVYDRWCNAGCPIGALAHPLVTYLGEALEKGAQARGYSYVTRVLTDDSGKRATGVEYFDRNKQKQVQPASVVVMAAFAAQNPRILLNSSTSRHPNGLGNSSGLVGAYMMTHMGAGVWGMFDEDVQNHMGLDAGLLASYDRYAKDTRKEAFGSTYWFMGIAQKPNDILGYANSRLDIFGQKLHTFMKDAARGLAKIQAFCEDLPKAENRVTLSQEKDEFGFPLARITHSYDEDGLKLWRLALDEGMQIAKLSGARESWPSGAPGAIHLAGGTIMGDKPDASVVDSYGRSHDVGNLVIAGPGLFPTEGAVHPTFTLHAVSLRAAEHLVKNWGTYAS